MAADDHGHYRDMYARGDQNEKYRAGTPFIFSLPGWLVRILKAPLRFIIHKERPERRREVAWVVLVYTLIFMGLSLFVVDFGVSRSRQEQQAINNPQKVIDSLLVEISQTDSRRKVSGFFKAFRPLGETAVNPMIKMLSDDWEVNREFAAMILGDIPAQRAVPHLILSLDDPDQRVRNQAAWSLGEIGSAEAKDPLIKKLAQDILAVSKSAIYRALEHGHPQVRRKAVFVLLEDPDPNATPYFEKMVDDEDFETRFFARQAIRQIDQQIGDSE
jgi:hypothetical protein